VLITPKAASQAAGEIEKSLSPLEPRAARAPVFDTLHAALDALGDPKDAPGAAILIAGTGDDCVGDVCSEAKRLHDAFPNTKLTVLGLGTSEQVSANYSCAAKAMGGGFLPAKSGTELDKLVRQALEIPPGAKPVQLAAASPATSKADAGKAPPAPAEGEPAENPAGIQAGTKAAPTPPPPAEPNLVLSAVLAEGSAVLDTGVTWELYKINTTPTGQLRTAETASWTGGGGQAKAKLPEGHYAVRVRYGFASAASDVTLGPGKTEKTVPLNAGTIAAEAYQARDASQAEGAFYALYSPKSSPHAELIGRSSESPALFHVNAGDYVLSASAGLAKLDAPVKVAAGKVSAVSIVLNTGIVQIDTFLSAAASKPAAAWHEIYATNAKQGDPPLLRLSGASIRMQLAAGNYRLDTTYGSARISTPLAVVPGQTVPLRLVLDAGEAKIVVRAGRPPQICAVYESGHGQGAQPAGRAAGTGISFILKAGRYDLECRPVNATAPARPKEISVAAGESTETILEE
jgi:hypothetical protein